jgi:hypothetical protein
MFGVVDEWGKAGFVSTAEEEADTLNTCSVNGELEGHPASAQVLFFAGEEGQPATIVLNVSW